MIVFSSVSVVIRGGVIAMKFFCVHVESSVGGVINVAGDHISHLIYGLWSSNERFQGDTKVFFRGEKASPSKDQTTPLHVISLLNREENVVMSKSQHDEPKSTQR